MHIANLSRQSNAIREQAARLLVEGFNEPRGWPTVELGREEVTAVLRDGFAFGMIEDERLLGWIGGLPEYHGRVWELHLTATLGTDDDSGMTSLADVDLYDDVPRHIAEFRDLGRQQPFLFYRKLGYVVTGVMPDANGSGRPDIFMSKRLT